MEERLDKILVQRNLVETRIKAEKVISEIGVKVNGKLVNKPGKKFAVDCKIVLVAEEFPWISVESLKLVEAINKWKLTIKDGVFIDVDCSKGEFTDVLLTNKAKKVYSINSIRDSLDQKLKKEDRIIDYTGKQLRELNGNNLHDELDGCVINESVLSLTLNPQRINKGKVKSQ
jgi:23S rRNA (cytidine1920-2'-O)/16S rRNA (cytidine1409-2'-O)-methyltransferase